MQDQSHNTVPKTPLYLGHAGLLPQIVCLLVVLVMREEWRFTAEMLAHSYAALIFSFLGGLWWGLAAAGEAQSGRPTPGWVYWAAIAPSLIALATYLPLWLIGHRLIAPMLIALGICLMCSPLVDKRLGEYAPGWWLKLRWPLSIRLGGLSVIVGILAWGT